MWQQTLHSLCGLNGRLGSLTKVGDIVTMQEIVNGVLTNVQYTVTAMDDSTPGVEVVSYAPVNA